MSRSESESSRETKRAQFAEPAKSRKKVALILVAVLAPAFAVAAYLVMSLSSERPSAIVVPDRPDKLADTRDVRVALAEITDGRAKFFDYETATHQRVRFFVVKSSENDYRAALDACEVCAHAKQGYRQEGDDMVCNNCGTKFSTALIGTIPGGCHPVGLKATVDGDSLVIEKSELEGGGQYF